MKNIQLVILSLFFLFFYACDKDLTNDEIQSIESLESSFDLNVQNEAIDLFAVAVSKSMLNEEFRSLIRNETNKQFDYDYDVLYRFIRDRTINVQDLGEINVETLLLKNIEDEISNSSFKTKEELLKYIGSIQNLNICVPYQYEDWKPEAYTPHVAILNHKYIDENGKAKCFDNSGKLYFLYKKDGHPKLPVVTVGLSERVDNEGKILVDPYGFVLDEIDRTISADEAYSIATSNLKSGKLWIPEPIVKVMDDTFFEACEKNDKTVMDKAITDVELDNMNNIECSLKSVNTLSAPTLNICRPAADFNNAAFIQWSQVTGATHFELQRKWGEGGTWQTIVTKDSTQTSDVNRWLNNGSSGYFYRVRAKNVRDGTYSNYSNEGFLRACWRKGYATERVDSIMLGTGVVERIAFLESRIILFAKLVLTNSTGTVIDYHNPPLGEYWTIGYGNGLRFPVGRDLFLWDMSAKSLNYYFYLWEWDGGGPLKITGSEKQIISAEDAGKFETTIGFEYTVQTLDDCIGFLDVYNYTPTLGWTPGEGLSLSPPTSWARIVISSN